MATHVPPKKNTALVTHLSLPSYGTLGRFQSNPTLAAGDVTISKDGGAFANVTNLPTITPAAGRSVELSLTSTEMNADNIIVVFSDQTNPPEWVDTTVTIHTSAQTLDEININIDANETKIDIIDTNVDAILVDTGTDIPATLATIDTVVDSIQVDTNSIETKIDTVDTVVDTILVDTNELQTDWANGGRLDLILDARASQVAVDDLPTNAELASALADADNAVLAAIDALPTALENADAVWDESLAAHQTAGSTGEALDNASSGVAPTVDQIADEIETRTLDANIVQVNNVTVTGVGTEANPWGP